MRTLADVAAIPDLTPEHVPFITEAVRGLVGELGATPLIGFAGAPFTVASYLVEGGPSKEHARTKAMMFGAPDVWDALMRKIAGIAATYLEVQVAAGASAVQLFDSWAGRADAARTTRTYVMPHSGAVLARAGALGVPRIHFGVGTANLLSLMGEAGADVVGVDWRTPLATAIPLVGDRAVQGNLDPTLVFAPTDVMTARAAEIIEAGRAARGHIFNLGHGVIPTTDPDQLGAADRVRAVLPHLAETSLPVISRRPRPPDASSRRARHGATDQQPDRDAENGGHQREREHRADDGGERRRRTS